MEPTRSDHLSEADLALRGLSRESDLRLDPQGRFFVGEQPVEHPGVAEAFSRWIDRAPDGRYVLRNDLHYVYLTVQGAPLFARALEIAADGASATLVLQGGERTPLRPDTLREGPDGALYASARDGTWPVRLLPRAALALAPLLHAGRGADEVELALGEHRAAVPTVEDPLRG